MIAAFLAGLTLLQPQSVTIDLFRGATVNGEGYWAVSDTDLDQSTPDKSKGGLFTLEGGKSKTVLIKFGDLDRVVPKLAKIIRADLILSPSSTDQPQFISIRSLKHEWGEGPSFSANLGRAVEEPKNPQWAATWKQRRSGKNGIDWQQSGALGPDDASVISSAKLETLDKEVAIVGLADTVQRMRDHWDENDGFALEFDGKCEFFSSQAKVGRPKLRVEYTLGQPEKQADLSVQRIDRIPGAPRNGDDVVYRATVSNVGEAPATPFQAQWSFGEKPGSRFAVNKTLAPGESTQIDFRKPFQSMGEDHRLQPVACKVFPSSPEPDGNNDCLEIHEDALRIHFNGAENLDGLQRIVRRINRVYFEQSRFSYAVDGVLERVRLAASPEDADFTVDVSDKPTDILTTRRVIGALTGLSQTNEDFIEAGGRRISINDPYAGLSGFGDSRNDGLIPAGIPMMYIPVANPLFDNLPIDANGLLSGIEVFAINSAIGKKGRARLGVLWDMPPTIILRATDLTGKPLDGAELGFYQILDGKIPDVPTQTVLTKEGGTVILENREIEIGLLDKDAPHQLKKNPFGNLRADGSNGIILVKAQINGETEWGVIKAWQFADAFHRGNKAAAIIDVRFNAPSGLLDRSTNLAKGRLVSDKAGSLPARLAALVDEDPSTEAELGAAIGDWVEIDLGRDRPIGEVKLLFKGRTMPAKFDVQAYATGQEAPDTDAWVRDLDFNWSWMNRGRAEGSMTALPYRGPMTRARFIRIVNRSGGAGKIGEVVITPLKAE